MIRRGAEIEQMPRAWITGGSTSHNTPRRVTVTPRLLSGRGFTATSHYFVMDWASVWMDIERPLVGPLVAIVSFVCSVGNVPLAAVRWRGGTSFGGVVSFIFADLIVFGALGIVPTQRNIAVFTEGPSLNYTTVLNVIFLVLAAVMVAQFLRTGGPEMLRMMDRPLTEHSMSQAS